MTPCPHGRTPGRFCPFAPCYIGPPEPHKSTVMVGVGREMRTAETETEADAALERRGREAAKAMLRSADCSQCSNVGTFQGERGAYFCSSHAPWDEAPLDDVPESAEEKRAAAEARAEHDSCRGGMADVQPSPHEPWVFPPPDPKWLEAQYLEWNDRAVKAEARVANLEAAVRTYAAMVSERDRVIRNALVELNDVQGVTP